MKIQFEINTEEDGIRKALDILHILDPENVKQKMEGMLAAASANDEDEDEDEDETIAEKKERKAKKVKKATKKAKKKTPAQEQEEEEESEDPVVTAADVRKAMKAYIEENGKKKAKKILSKYAEKISEVDEDDFADLVADLQ